MRCSDTSWIGSQGVGKGFFASVIGKILDPHYIELNDPLHLVGRFNQHLCDKLLIYADEGSFSKGQGADKLKNLITSEHVLIEQLEADGAAGGIGETRAAVRDDRQGGPPVQGLRLPDGQDLEPAATGRRQGRAPACCQ